MAPKPKVGSSKGGSKRSVKPAQSAASSKPKKKSTTKPVPAQHKPRPRTVNDKKKKPPHLRYTEKELKIPRLNGILPAGVQKRPNAKKGKTFVDDKESMNTILALVMAEKEGNIESKMIRARQMEEVREARRIEAEKRAQSKKQGLEDRKDEIRQSKKRRRGSESEVVREPSGESGVAKRTTRKRVSFG